MSSCMTEAKFKLQSTSERDEAVGQIWVSLFSNAAALYSVAIYGAASDSHEKYSMLKNYNNLPITSVIGFATVLLAAKGGPACQ